MTPRTINQSLGPNLSWFSQKLFDQLKTSSNEFNLTGNGPLFKVWHPALIKVQYLYENHPEDLSFRTQSSGWSIQSFENLDEALAQHGQESLYEGLPWGLHKFLVENNNSGLINFKDLGAVFLTRESATLLPQSNPQLHHHLLPVWLDYALSPELWGPAGKWTRFHARLLTLFTKYGLLIKDSIPGHYSLNLKAQWLINSGFKGKLTEDSFDLIFPWDFPLSGLIELEKALARGP